MTVLIVRSNTIQDGTIGRLQLVDENSELLFSCYTLEPSGEETTERNKDRRIPQGSYKATIRYSPRFDKELYNLYNQKVPLDRYILIHAGNYPKDTEGCILVGDIWDRKGIYNSRKSLAKFMELTKGEPLLVEIINNFTKDTNES